MYDVKIEFQVGITNVKGSFTLKKEQKEQRILRVSLIAGLIFALAELIFAIFSHSQSVLMDAVYDACESVFIALIIFLTPLFYKPASEEHPYGYFQIESIFLIIKSVMLISVSLGVSMEVLEAAVSGGNTVNELYVASFQLVLAIASVFVFLMMKRMNRHISSPTVHMELMGWKVDIAYSAGMALAFFASTFLAKTSLAFLRPYFDPVVAVIVMLLMMPDTLKVLRSAMRDLFLFPPEEETVDHIKEICTPIMEENGLSPVSFDILKTGRHMWISVYFETPGAALLVKDLKRITDTTNAKIKEEFANTSCELILVP